MNAIEKKQRDTDFLVAERVMGWTRWENGLWTNNETRQWHVAASHIPKYSTKISAAWAVRARMESMGWESEDRLSWIGWGGKERHPYGYQIWFRQWIEGGVANAFVGAVKDFNDAPMAICEVALRAVGKCP